MNKEENDLLTQTDRGTPCGELMRRYWQPVALAEELPSGGAPLAVRILGEDLVLFRDDKGRPGLLEIHCSHRGADLSYGRVEDGGIRCLYHGWLYDINGCVIETPADRRVSQAELTRIRHPAYPCQEKAGTIFAYLGPGDPPYFPNYEFLSVSPEHVYGIKILHECNYLQANEGNIDLSHLSFLHYNRENRGVGGEVGGPLLAAQEAISRRGADTELEECDVELTPYGLRSYKVRHNVQPEKYHLYITEFVLPNLTSFPGRFRGWYGYAVNWHVPIDDKRHWKYTLMFRRDVAVDREHLAKSRADIDAEYKPVANKANRYRQDRESMREESFSGLGKRPDGGITFQIQDLWATEGQGPIQDRTREHLMPSDQAVLASRKILVKAIRDLQEGREPANVARDAAKNRFPIVSLNEVLPDSKHWRERAKELEKEVTV